MKKATGDQLLNHIVVCTFDGPWQQNTLFSGRRFVSILKISFDIKCVYDFQFALSAKSLDFLSVASDVLNYDESAKKKIVILAGHSFL